MDFPEGGLETQRINPYEAPRSALPKVVGNAKLDQVLAKRNLEARAQGGLSIGFFLRLSMRRYLILGVYFVLVEALCIQFQLWAILVLLIGIYLGGLIRDLGQFKASVRAWPFSERVMDWDKVQRIADAEE
jgi:hypothetical protein